jgi:glycosyltransferase involved in cell wall biosynthesis
MKIALICNEYPPHPHGGIGTFVREFAHALDGAGHQVFVFGVRDKEESYTDGRIQVHMVGGRKIPYVSWLTRRLPFWLFLRNQVKIHKIDVVESTDFMGQVPFAVGCPVVVRLHQTATGLAKYKGQKPRLSNIWFEERQLRAHPAWIAMSKHALSLTRDLFPRAKPKRTAVIPPPLDLPAPAASIGDIAENYILHAGFVEATKGAFAVAEAAVRFLQEDPTLKLVYAGAIVTKDGVPADEVIRDIVGPELAQRVVFLGWVERSLLLALMAKARMLLFPSQLETFGLVAAEAMLQGCAVVVSNYGPFPEFVRHEETGLLVEAKDVDALAASAIRLLRDPQFADKLARQGQAYIAGTYSRDRHLRETLLFYEEILS